AYGVMAFERASEALERVRWSRWRPGPERPFADLFGVPGPWPLHEVLRSLRRDLDGPSFVLVEAPMGEGKTEAAFDVADHLCRTAGHGGLFVGLPTQATSNKMLRRTEDFLV